MKVIERWWMMKTTISFLKSKYSREETLERINSLDADYLHVDVMDGKFVDNFNFKPADLPEILKLSKMVLDVHLMVENPVPYIEKIKKLNVKYITTHVELEDKMKYIDLIHSYGIGAGLAINPETDVKKLYPYLDKIQYVIVMGVHPGQGGQKLIPETVLKIIKLQEMKKDRKLDFEICIDGGVNAETRSLVAPADVIVLGSALCMSDDYQETLDKLR